MKLKVAQKALKNMLLCSIVFLPLQASFGIIPSPKDNTATAEQSYDLEVPPSAQPKVILLDIKEEFCDTECFLKKNSKTVEFLAKTFGINSSYVYEDLIKKNEYTIYNEKNIGLINSPGEYSSFEEGLIEYLIAFSKANPTLVDNTHKPYSGGKDYVVDLIKYFTGIYTNVDYLTAVAIGAAESGHYQVKYMLNANNIYGGMGYNQTLLRYKNIEYGVLSYIRLLSKNYFGQGRTTFEEIGRVYNPVFDASGNKVANPHWLYLVNNMASYYKDTQKDVTIAQLVD